MPAAVSAVAWLFRASAMRPLLLALEKMGLQAHEAVAFEDTEHGVASAIAAGLACVAIPTAMSAVQDFSIATVVVPDMASAVDWVLKQG